MGTAARSKIESPQDESLLSPAFHPSAFSRDELIVCYSLRGIPVADIRSYFTRFTVMLSGNTAASRCLLVVLHVLWFKYIQCTNYAVYNITGLTDGADVFTSAPSVRPVISN